MPLPFMTAGRGFDATDDVALPYDDHDQWRRPYRLGPWRVGVAAVLLLLASFILLATVITALAAGGSGAVVCAVVAAVVIAVALRMLRMGTWVSRHGVRRVSLLHTSTVAWNQASAVRTVQQPVRWLGLPRTVQGQALVLVRRRGEHVPLLTTHSADFLSRGDAFERAADTVEAWGAEYQRAH
ncbi:hypothetical protein [Streptomyces montanisoli]|uniref:PH domain-containing protein n=1 Tax=Streptomyces montanisoli TaxID=2798581 RepID=A0A940MIM4_9ACTN|nr:hypothetical protein [Streptomyces montanisoli]MBP0460377.1 hypothetical protein [Streptomyces montanisoli]